MPEPTPPESPSDPATEKKGWGFQVFFYFLLADQAFVLFHVGIRKAPSPDNWSFLARLIDQNGMWGVQYLAAVVLGLVLSLLVALIEREDLRRSTRAFWYRAFWISLAPAALLAYISWWSANL